MPEINTKKELLYKLQNYVKTPDDNNIRYKEIIKKILISSPELLYALHRIDLENELFNKNGSINFEGEWDLYFGESSSIRPFLFIPETQTEVINYICYQVSFQELLKSNCIEQYTLLTFNIFVHKNDSIDLLTGIARHDLIASIIREKINWSHDFGMQAQLVSSKETTTDSNYITRTLVFQILDTNNINYTPYGEDTYIINNDFETRW